MIDDLDSELAAAYEHVDNELHPAFVRACAASEAVIREARMSSTSARRISDHAMPAVKDPKRA